MQENRTDNYFSIAIAPQYTLHRVQTRLYFDYIVRERGGVCKSPSNCFATKGCQWITHCIQNVSGKSILMCTMKLPYLLMIEAPSIIFLNGILLSLK